MKHLGNGEGFTTLILTDKESRLIRASLANYADSALSLGEHAKDDPATAAFNAGIQRATARIAEEFAQEQKRRKALKPGPTPTVQKDKP